MKEPIIILPLSQYEELKEQEKAVEPLKIKLTDAIMEAAIPRLLAARERLDVYSREEIRQAAVDIAKDVFKRLKLDWYDKEN